MKLASWNINSIRQRLSHVQEWLLKERPDWLFLQEIKCQDEQFPRETFEAMGYHVIVHGQKAYHGVATLSRHPYELIHKGLPNLKEDKPQARYLEIKSQGIYLGNLYLPNGNSGGEAGFQAKLNFMNALADRAKTLLDRQENCIFAGDFNVCPTSQDFAEGTLSPDDALIRPESRNEFYRLLWLGLTDSLRALYPMETLYTFWDYTKGAWQRNSGLRIDHILLSPKLAEKLTAFHIDKEERDKQQPSDHVPVMIEF